MRAFLLLLLLCGCPAAHSDYPSKSCSNDNQCYADEKCNLAKQLCEPNADGGTP